MPVRKPTLRGIAERNALVEANQWLVRATARRFRSSRLGFDDLVAAGQLGLIRAAERCRPGNGKFAEFARRFIQRSIQESVWEASSVVTIPIATHKTMHGWGVALTAASMDAGRRAVAAESFTYAEAADGHHWSAPDRGPARIDARDEVDSLLRQIPAREAKVIRLRFGLTDGREHTPFQISRLMGMRQLTVKQLEASGMERLRELATA